MGICRRRFACLRSLQTDKWYEITPETLKLAFLSGDYAFILQNYAAVYEGWIVQPEEYRIVYKAFQEAAADRLDEFETFRDTVVIPFCEENPNIDTTELMKAVTESGSSAGDTCHDRYHPVIFLRILLRTKKAPESGRYRPFPGAFYVGSYVYSGRCGVACLCSFPRTFFKKFVTVRR